MGRRERGQPSSHCLQAEPCCSASRCKTTLAGQARARSPWDCCTCATHTRSSVASQPCFSYRHFRSIYLVLCLFTFVMAFSFSLCRAKTQTALHTPESSGNLFTLKMSSILQRKTNKVSSVSSTSSGRSA